MQSSGLIESSSWTATLERSDPISRSHQSTKYGGVEKTFVGRCRPHPTLSTKEVIETNDSDTNLNDGV
jgi:hypothetical protein